MVGLKGKEVSVPVRRPGKDDQPRRRARHREERAEAEAPGDRTEKTNSGTDWRDVAMRLRADMDNYRKRQKRWAKGEILEEKVRLLTRFLDVVDNLEQTLEHLDPGDPNHQAVQLAYDGMMKLLIREGAERIFALGRAFDPRWHDAVAMVPAPGDQDEEMRVVEVTSPGYRLDSRILRPAKVVVAKREI